MQTAFHGEGRDGLRSTGFEATTECHDRSVLYYTESESPEGVKLKNSRSSFVPHAHAILNCCHKILGICCMWACLGCYFSF